MKKLLLLLAVVAGAMTAGAQGEEIPEDAIVVLEYIKSTGQQAFNTKYTHTSTTMVQMGCVIEQDHQKNYEALFGARLGNHQHNAFCFFSRFNGQDVPCYNRSGNEKTGSGLPYNRYVEVAAMGQMAAWGTEDEGLLGSVTTTGTADDGQTPMLIFNLNTSNTVGGVQIDTSPCCMSLYEFNIYEGDYNMKHAFVPAKKNGVIGLFDRLTGEFGGSITSTPFVAGPEKHVLYPVRVTYTVGGKVEPDVYAVQEDSWVGFTITRYPGYGIQSISLKDNDGNDVEYSLAQEEGDEGLYFFQMPKGGANLNVVFKSFPQGDVNGDTKVDIADAQSILNIMADEDYMAEGDINKDNKVDVADYQSVLNIMAAGDDSPSTGGSSTGGDVDDENRIYQATEVEEAAQFPDGDTALNQWIQQNLQYPQAAYDAKLSGRVIVKFVVEKDGSISNAEIYSSANEVFNDETLRLVNSMPNWTPAKKNGQPVRFQRNLPIMFRYPG